MTDTDESTTEGGAPAASAGGAAPEPEAATYLSRIAGLDAKVSTLTNAQLAEKARADAAEKKLSDYEAGVVKGDEALRAQLAAEQANTATARKEAALARIEAKYPETFALFGEDAANMSADKLAASEARLKGVAPEPPEPPTPGTHNEPSTTQPKPKGKPKTAEDVEAELLSMATGW